MDDRSNHYLLEVTGKVIRKINYLINTSPGAWSEKITIFLNDLLLSGALKTNEID